MDNSEDEKRGMSRREFLETSGLTTLALSTGALTGVASMATAAQGSTETAGSVAKGPYNILFILTDQERYFDPAAYPPG